MKKIWISIGVVAICCCSLAFAYNETYVMYNTNSGIYHKPFCKWARKCTVNCIRLKKDEAIQRGGRPCRVCGG